MKIWFGWNHKYLQMKIIFQKDFCLSILWFLSLCSIIIASRAFSNASLGTSILYDSNLIMEFYIFWVWISVSNGTGQCNFLGQRDRNSFLVPGQRDKLKILPRDGILTACPVPGRPAGQKWKKKHWKNGIFFSMISCFRTSFPVLERPLLN